MDTESEVIDATLCHAPHPEVAREAFARILAQRAALLAALEGIAKMTGPTAVATTHGGSMDRLLRLAVQVNGAANAALASARGAAEPGREGQVRA